MTQQSPGYPRQYEQPTAYQDPYRQQPMGPQYPGYPQGPGYPQPPQKPKKSIWKRWWMICVYVLVGLIILGSIGSGGSASKTDSAGHGVNSPAASASAGGADASSAAKFGQAYAYDDGLSITVSAPVPYQPT